MKFEISRTSVWDDKICPLEGVANSEPVQEGPKGYTRPGWFLELDSIEALAALVDYQGPIVVTGHGNNGARLCIEIYDDYRE